MNFRTFARVIAGISVACLFAISAHAQPFPSRPIRIVVGFAPGSATDTIARLYGNKLSEVLKTSVIIDNKAGASQLLAIRTLMAAPPDGYTLMVAGGSGLSVGPGVRKDLGYDPLKDFSLVAFMATSPGLITVNASQPLRTLDDLVQYAKAHPDGLSYSSAGLGSAGHLGLNT
jgi:tripartite-type tricarboxylate transporter receptor subunit TctC